MDENELRICLIIAMDKLHRHVMHASTNFEDRALKAVGEEPWEGHLSGYRNKWRHLANTISDK